MSNNRLHAFQHYPQKNKNFSSSEVRGKDFNLACSTVPTPDIKYLKRFSLVQASEYYVVRLSGVLVFKILLICGI